MQTAAGQASSFWNVPPVLAGTLTEQAASGRRGRRRTDRAPPSLQGAVSLSPAPSRPCAHRPSLASCGPVSSLVSRLMCPLTDKTSRGPLLRVTGVAAHLHSHRCPLCFW